MTWRRLTLALLALFCASASTAQVINPGRAPGAKAGFRFLPPTAAAQTSQRLATYGDVLGSSLAMWFDASDNATVKNASGTNAISGDVVGTWIDKSVSSGARTGTPATATQATAARQPVYNATGLNNMPAIIPAGSQFLSIAAGAQPPKYNATTGISAVAVVGRPSGTGAVFSSGNNGNDQGGPELRWDQNTVNMVSSYTTDIVRSAAAAAGPHIIGFDASSAGTTVWLDGVATTVSTNAAFTSTISQIMVNVFGSDYYNGQISEIIYSSSRMTSNQSSTVRGIAACRWKLQSLLPANDNYKTACPMVSAN